MPNVLLRQMAIDAGAMETVLLRDGFMTEGAASNIIRGKERNLAGSSKKSSDAARYYL